MLETPDNDVHIGFFLNPLFRFSGHPFPELRVPDSSGSPTLVNGYRISLVNLMRSLFFQADSPESTFYLDPHFIAPSQELIRYLRGLSGRSPVLKDARALGCADGSEKVDVWFQPNEAWMHLISLRNRCDTHVKPVCSVIHSISYRHYRQQLIVPTLLGEIYPFDTIVCSSHAAKTALAEIFASVSDRLTHRVGKRLTYQGSFATIGLPVDTERFRPLPKMECRTRLDIPPDAFVVLYAGRFNQSEKMDLTPLLIAFKRMQGRHPVALHLVLAGSDTNNYAVELLTISVTLGLKERVRIIANPESELMPVIYSSADVFVSLPDNVQESFGITPVEAMACGVPQVVADWDGYRDTVVDGCTGFLVPTYWGNCTNEVEISGDFLGWGYEHLITSQCVGFDYEYLQQKVDLLICDEALRRDMSNLSRRRAVEHFSYHSILRDYLALWRTQAEESRSVRSIASGDYRIPEYFREFGHYSTTWVIDDDFLRISPEVGVLDRGAYEVINEWQYDLRFLNRIIQERALAYIGAEELRLGTLIERLMIELEFSEDYTRRNLLWLIKYGLITFYKDNAKSPTLD